MKYNGTVKQNKWADDILRASNLNETQIDNLLRYAGPAMHEQGIMDVTIIIENRHDLAGYADALGKLYNMTPEERHNLAAEACSCLCNRG